MKTVSFILACVFSLVALLFNIARGEERHHFFDSDGKPLSQYESVYPELMKYFTGHTLPKIIVREIHGTSSLFNTGKREVLVSVSSRTTEARKREVVGHESAHLCLARLTDSASKLDEFRFFDEGFAEIFESMIGKRDDEYKKKALSYASDRHEREAVSFERVQKWSEYFKKDGIRDSNVYMVGSSFDFYVIDTYGLDRLFRFFGDIGKTRNLDTSLKNVFKKDKASVEKEWTAYISTGKVKADVPRIVKIFPANGASDVSASVLEIFVEFDRPMKGNISLISSDNSCVSYTNARWKSHAILSVAVKLKPHQTYLVKLGNEKNGNRLTSAEGVEFPVTEWMFSTGPEK